MTLRCLPALATLLVCGCAAAAQVPGRTEASYSVSFNGESNYSVPLWTPPGINGIQPSLALVYSSNGGPGHFGMGWSLSGLTSIHRCQKTWTQDGGPRDVRNDISDRFCLDGNQLKLTTGTYGSAGSTYQTEIETFSRVTAYGAAGNGPAYFIVEGRDGLYYEYGSTTDSRIESLGQTTARAWLINKVRDRNDNAMLISYTEDATNGSYRVASIQYTQNITAGVSADYAVEFVYQSVPAAEVDSQYLAGSQVKRVMRADRIDVKAAGSVVRRYELTYEASLSTTSRSRLASIQECGVAATNCFAPTNFTYQNGVSGLNAEASTGQSIPANVFPWPLDVNGDGRQDLVYPSSAVSGSGTWIVMFASTTGGYVTPVTNTGITNTNWSGAIPIDYNADGREDLLVPSTGGTWSVLTSNGATLTGPANTFAPVVGTGTGMNARALDIDGDGYEDLVWAELIGYAGGDTIRWRRRDPAANFEATVGTLVGPMPVDKMIMSGAFAPAGQSRRLRAPDFNGDGRGDLAYQTTRRVLNEVSGTYTFFRHVSVYCAGGTEFFAAVTAPTTPEYGDFNGDGRTDLLYTTGSPVFSFVFQYSKGTSFTSAVFGPSAATYGPQRFIITDWDSDGQDDLVAPNPNTSQWDLIRSTGEGFATTVGTGISSSVSATTVTDVNGDGLMDLGYVVSGAWRYRLHAGPQPDLLLTATDGFGLQTSFSYIPITQNNYTRTSGAVFPDQEYTGPQYVVATMTAPTGIQSPATFTTSYWYYGARRHLQGRGFLGFSSRRTIDSRNQLRVYEYASQTFPYVGMQKEVVVKQPNVSG